MINNVVLVGRMTRDAELRYTPSNVAVATFTLAVNRTFKSQNGEREADFINVVMWRQQAENLANWAKKGSLVGITGRIQTRSYDNQQGQRVYVTEVVADNFQMLESRSAREGQSGGAYSAPTANHAASTNSVPDFSRDENPFGATNPLDISDDDLPF
ncbi:single-stranded DNA-binding protein [Streptococcus infantis]|uniref:single-stranded DNA-binding protein n=1 Tax=Streptococcus infantis TaxID=68892 RepID=UPI001BD9D3A1|nr:single-stranded DNA-binding protein [Streptococcus infantis]MBT0951149.1 single-stranded DNA-binding protein [Streptococcus infantis]